MLNSKLRLHPLSFAVSLALLPASFQTMAQEANANADNDEVERIEVVGFRNQVATAQDIKRNANTVKDVITASDIGSLPDKSVTEALQRVPGVSIERFDSSDDPNHFSSEGTGVIVRGLKRVRSEINGRDSFSASPDGAGLNYADIPGELLGSVEVVKNTTADLIAGGVAGTVNLVTRKPFDNDGQVVFAQVKGTYGDHAEEWTPVLSGLYSNTWDSKAGKFGFLVSASSSSYEDKGDGVAVDNFYERSTTANETEYFGDAGTAIPGFEDQVLYTPAYMSIRSADSERDRTGLATSLQWQSADETMQLTFEYIHSKAEKMWEERVVDYGERGYEVNPNNIQYISGDFDGEGFMHRGELAPNFFSAATRINDVETDIDDISIHFTYQPNDNLKLDFDLQHIESTNQIRDYTMTTRMENTQPSWFPDGVIRPDTPVIYTGAQFDLNGSHPRNVNFTGDMDNILYPEQAYLKSKMDHEEDNDAESDSFAFDLTYTFDSGWMHSFKTGLYASSKDITAKDSIWNWQEYTAGWVVWGGDVPFSTSVAEHPEFFEQYTFNQGDFFGGGVLNGDQTFYFPRLDGVRNFDAFGDSINAIDELTFPAPDLGERDNTTGSYLGSEISDTTEDRVELYAQLNFEFTDLALPITGNVGLRYISWEVESTGGATFPTVPWYIPQEVRDEYPDETAFSNGAEGATTTLKGDEYTKVLPSLNLSMEVADDQIVRFAISENVYFPTFKNFRNYQNMYTNQIEGQNPIPGQPNIVGMAIGGDTGNPMIEPEEAFNLDLTYEWYFADAGSLTTSFFYKEIDNIIRERLFTVDVENPSVGVTVPVDFQMFDNDGSGDIQGIEFAYTQFYDFLPGFWGGFGISANWTHLDQSSLEDDSGFGNGVPGEGNRNNFRAFTNLDLPGYSDDTFNFTLMYEKYDVSARLAYNWRSEYLLTRRDANLFAPVEAQETGLLDASIAYRINDNFTVGFEASNLTDEIIETEMIYNQEGKQTPRAFNKTDRRYGLFVKAAF
ncbi:TonB-dependent receptor [Catenovulum sp. SM1970]|uniref:TonB-dependent receptor n=1 Tax=Marinifaba aquimaris TaxID=2741323 RepID=UPI001573ADE9|nr:TonB-dependent receptor [Marinifaba aquimaris]NTS78747.1 TonB-dependent receptor [Marinifaba aquimaris]